MCAMRWHGLSVESWHRSGSVPKGDTGLSYIGFADRVLGVTNLLDARTYGLFFRTR